MSAPIIMLNMTVVCVIASFCYYFNGMAIYDKPFSWKGFWILAISFTSVKALCRFCLGMDSAVGAIAQLLIYPFFSWVVFKQRGVRLAIGSMVYFVVSSIFDAVTGFVVINVWSMEVLDSIRNFDTQMSIYVNYSISLVIIVLSVAFLWIARAARGRIHLDKPWLYVIRPIAMMAVTLAVDLFAFNRAAQYAPGESVFAKYTLLLATIAQTSLCAIYVQQDIRFLKLARSNESLVRQQHIYDTLLTDTRAFRFLSAPKLLTIRVK